MKNNWPRAGTGDRVGISRYHDGRGPGGRWPKQVTFARERWIPVTPGAEWLEYEQRETERLARMERALYDEKSPE